MKLLIATIAGLACLMPYGSAGANSKKCAIFDAKWFRTINAMHEKLRTCQINSQPRTEVLYHACHGENRTTAYPQCQSIEVDLCFKRKKRNRETKRCYDRTFTGPTDDVAAANGKLKKQLKRTRRFSDPAKNIADTFKENPDAVAVFQKGGGIDGQKANLLYNYLNQMARGAISMSTRDRLIKTIQLNAFREADRHHRQLLKLFNNTSRDLATTSAHFKRRIAALESGAGNRNRNDAAPTTGDKFTFRHCVGQMRKYYRTLYDRGLYLRPTNEPVVQWDCKHWARDYRSKKKAYKDCRQKGWGGRSNNKILCDTVFR